MSEPLDVQGIAAAGDEVAPATRGRSHAEKIRERRRRRQQAGPPELELVLPEGEVVVFYERTKMKAIRAAAKNRGALGANISLLLRACKRIELRDPDTGDQWPASQDTDQPELPVQFDGRLADLLGLDAKDPAGILVQTFEGNDRAIISHAMRLDRWSAGEDQDADDPEDFDELLGEANAAT